MNNLTYRKNEDKEINKINETYIEVKDVTLNNINIENYQRNTIYVNYVENIITSNYG